MTPRQSNKGGHFGLVHRGYYGAIVGLYRGHSVAIVGLLRGFKRTHELYIISLFLDLCTGTVFHIPGILPAQFRKITEFNFQLKGSVELYMINRQGIN